MSEKTIELPEPIEDEGRLFWHSKLATVELDEDGHIWLDSTVYEAQYTPKHIGRLRELGLALLAAVDAAEKL